MTKEHPSIARRRPTLGPVRALALAIISAALWSGAGQAQTRVEKIFDNWRVVCVEPAEGADGTRRCAMSQTLLAQSSRRPLVRWVIVPEPERKTLGLAISAPLGVLLKPGLRLSFGDQDAVNIPYTVCGPRWCQATLQLSDELRAELAGHEGVQVSFVRRNGRRLALEAPLKGFAAALEHLLAQSGMKK